MKAIYFLILFTIIFLASCGGTEPFIDHYDDNTMFILQIENGKLHKLDTKYNTLKIINLEGNNGIIDIGKITTIKKFKNKHYLLSPELKKIFVLDVVKNNKVIEINSNFTPIDICFPNATDGYIINAENVITILDLTNNIFSNLSIYTNSTLKHIDGFGNQIHITSPEHNTVYIFDTRSNQIEDSITTISSPDFIKFNRDGNYSVIVTDNPAKMFVYDVINDSLYKELFIGNNENTAKNIQPTGLEITEKNVIITSTNSSTNNYTTWRINANNFRTYVGFSKKSSTLPIYSQTGSFFSCVESNPTTLVIFDATNNDKKNTIQLDAEPWIICPY